MSHVLRHAVVDSSALMCIVMNEAASPLFTQELFKVDFLYISAVTLSEGMLAAMAAKEAGVLGAMKSLVASLKVSTVEYTAADVPAYLRAAQRYHIKAVPPGPLNMGDLFSFHLATKLDLPLFFQGMDFLQTPVKNAMHMRGYLMNADNKGVPSVHAS